MPSTVRRLLPTAATVLGLLLAAPAAAYQLTPDELKLDCKKLTGRMQIRLLQIRDRAGEAETSFASRAMQSAIAPVIGGSTHGTDPAGAYAGDVAVLKAYNARLAEKGCRTFDLDAELKSKPVGETPRPMPRDKPASPKK